MENDCAPEVLGAARRAADSVSAPLLLAVSGGLDSMTLLHAMHAVALNQIAAVATFDHGTGPAATRAVRLVCEVAGALSLPVVVGRQDSRERLRRGEASWRAARHGFLSDAGRRAGARVVMAHTEDDHLETLLMRIMRGSGARGMAGLYAESPIVRPFIQVRRRALEAYAKNRRLVWVDDPSNASPDFFRNRVRRDLLPALRRVEPQVDGWMLSLAARAQELRAEVDAHVSQYLRPDVRRGRVRVDASELDGYARDSLAVLWSSLAARVGLALDRRGTERIAAFTMSRRSYGSIPLSGGWCVEASGDFYTLQRAELTVAAPAPLPLRGGLVWGNFRFQVQDTSAVSSAWTASIAGSEPVVVRAWSAGDRLGPAAGKPQRRVTRYLSEGGVRGRDRASWPVVVAGDDVVWIPGVRRSDAATDRSGRPVRHYVCERIDR